jgi:DMSO reductase anchor subunit
MAKLKDKVQNALDESRILILGAQVIMGFQFRSVLEKGFEALPFTSQLVKLGGVGLMVATVALLISPSAYHRIVERGEDTHDIHRYASRIMEWALLPFALGLGVELYVATAKILSRTAGVVAGVLIIVAAIFFWYVYALHMRRERAGEIEEERMKEEEREKEREKEGEPGGGSKITDRIRHVLTETRVILPGVQALLGFQFAAILMEGFDKLPNLSKYVHLASLLLIALTIVLLVAPAAYHRIAERGEETEHFHRFASRMIVAALVPLALGLSASVYVVVHKILDSQLVGVVAALVALALFWELWFGLTVYRRTQRDHAK